MGQQHSNKQQRNFSDDQIEKSIQKMFNDKNQRFSINDVALPISLVLQNLKFHIPICKVDSGIVLNKHMLNILYHGQFVSVMMKLINLLIEKLQEVGDKNILLIKRHQWGILSELVKFILIFTDQKLIQTVQIYTIRLSELDPSIKVMIEQLQQTKSSFNAIQKKVIDKLRPNIAESLYAVLNSTLLKLIQQNNQPINRSSQTLLIIQHVEQSLFMLFNKLVFTPHHYKAFIVDKGRNTIALKDFIRIGQYFLCSSCNLSLPSVFQSAVLLLLCLIQKNTKNLKIVEKDVRGLSSFIFPNLPVINKKSIYDFIAIICLFSLVYIKQGTNSYQRFAFNRLITLRLLNVLVRQVKVTSGQITEYIEQLSLQTKIGMTERSFVTEIVKKYVKLIEDKIVDNREQQEIKKNISKIDSTIKTLSKISTKVINRIKRLPRQQPIQQTFTTNISAYTRESKPSQILINYLQSGAQPYSIKFKGKRYTIPYIDVVDEIEKDDKQLQKQLKPLYEKFIYEFILYKKVIYIHKDKYVWQEILPKVIAGRGLQGEEISQSQMSQISQSNESRINVVGQAPVLSYKLSQRKAKNNLTQSSISKSKVSSQNNRFDTEQQFTSNQRTQQAKAQYIIKPQTRFNQWENIQSKRKLSQGKSNTPKNNLKQSEDLKFHAENSQNHINMPQIDKNDNKVEIGEFYIENLE